MRKRIFELLSLIENDLAIVYGELQRPCHDPALLEIYDFMVKHCRLHAQKIKSLEEDHQKLEINEEDILKFHKTIREALREKIDGNTPEDVILQLLESTEESLGQLYHSMAGHFWRVARYYDQIGNDLEDLAGEEVFHKDVIRKKSVVEEQP